MEGCKYLERFCDTPKGEACEANLGKDYPASCFRLAQENAAKYKRAHLGKLELIWELIKDSLRLGPAD